MTTGTAEAESPHLLLRLEFVPANPADQDPAALDAVAHGVIADLRAAHYPVDPLYTGTKGLGEVFQWAPILLPLAQAAWDQRELLLAAFEVMKPILEHLLKEQPHGAADPQEPRLVLQIHGDTVEITQNDLANLAVTVD